ncbi:MAG: glycine cleavage system protein H [Acidobacteriota bacterium]|nr:glycine cleavage system protein H [Acidobacteriota bacterium]
MVAILVAFMFIGLVLTDAGVEKLKVWRAARATRPIANTLAFGPEMLWQIPEGVHLSDAHTWFRPDPAGGLEIGADSLIAHAIGAVLRIVLPQLGEEVSAGQPLFRLEKDGRSITLPCTITGKVMAVNGLLQKQPGLLNSDPYGVGWICRITPTSIAPEMPTMRFGEKAMMWLESEFTRLREFLSTQISAEFALGATSQDGGFPSSGCLGELDKAAWSAFEAEFLKWKQHQ